MCTTTVGGCGSSKLSSSSMVSRWRMQAHCFCGAVRSPTDTCGHHAVQMPPLPIEQDAAHRTLFMRTYGWGSEIQNPDPAWAHTSGPKYTWLHEARPLIDGEPLTAFTRAAMAGDITASIANWGTHGLQFINADYTVTLSRLPEGPHLGLASLTHHSHDGVATGSAVLVDRMGPVGTAVSVAIAQSGFPPPTANRRRYRGVVARVGPQDVLDVDRRCGRPPAGPAASRRRAWTQP